MQLETARMKLVALAGGIGAAKFLRGLVQVADPAELTVVANTGDDITLHGLHVSPDLDTIAYTLGGGVHREQGWGRADERFTVAEELQRRYGRSRWFTLGDRDIATHLVRTEALRGGATLSQATRELAAAWDLPFTLLPMTDDPVATRVRTRDGRELHFQEWWVGQRAEPEVERVWLDGAERARPAPGVLEAIAAADAVLLCPSNPVVSIGTILAVPGVREALREPVVVGVSPIVGGRVVRGMADKLLPAVGLEVSAAAVAESYADFLDGWVIDSEDFELAGAVQDTGILALVTDTIMVDDRMAAFVASCCLDLVRLIAGKRERGEW